MNNSRKHEISEELWKIHVLSIENIIKTELLRVHYEQDSLSDDNILANLTENNWDFLWNCESVCFNLDNQDDSSEHIRAILSDQIFTYINMVLKDDLPLDKAIEQCATDIDTLI